MRRPEEEHGSDLGHHVLKLWIRSTDDVRLHRQRRSQSTGDCTEHPSQHGATNLLNHESSHGVHHKDDGVL